MASFKLSINVEPRDIPFLDDAHKRDCADAITAAVNSTLKYTLIMTGAVMAVYAAYSFFGFNWMLRMNTMLPTASAVVPALAVVIFIFEFISGTMKGWALGVQLCFHVAMIFASVTTVPTLVVLPFAIYGGILHFKLISLLPWYNVISVQQGYPDFTPLPERKQSPSDEKDEGSEMQEESKKSETTEIQDNHEKSGETKNQSEDNKSVAAENHPGEKQSEIVKNQSGTNKSSKKKHKNRKRKK